MKKHLLTGMALICAALSAQALTVVPEPESTQDFLSVISITFEGYDKAIPCDAAYYSPDTTPAYGELEGNKEVKLVLVPMIVNTNTVSANLTPDLITASYINKEGIVGATACKEGEYTFVIPAGAYTLYKGDETTLSEEISVKYNIGEVTFADVTASFSALPAVADEFTSVTLSFSPAPESVVVRNPAGFHLRDRDSMSMGFFVTDLTATVNDDMTVTLTSPQPYIKGGTYSVYVEEKALEINGLPSLWAQSGTFEITGDLQERKISVVPDPETPVTELREIMLVYEGYQSLSFNESAQLSATLVPYLTGPGNIDQTYVCSYGPLDHSLSFMPLGTDPENPGQGFTTPGSYTLTIPANFITADGATNAEPMTYTFTIEKGEAPAEQIITVTPQPGTPVNQFQEITMMYEGYSTLTFNEIGQETNIVHCTLSTPDHCTFPYRCSLAKEGLGFTFKPVVEGRMAPFSVDGDYIFTIPANFITVDGLPNAEDIAFTFVVEGGLPLADKKITASPDGDITSIKEIEITFTGYYQLAVNDACEEKCTLQGPDATLDYTCSLAPEGLQLVLTPADGYTVTTPGTYTLTIPAGMLTVDGAPNQEPLTFSFEVTVASGLQELDTIQEARYFDLQGHPVANPGKGVYIRVLPGAPSRLILK